jgi:hypothetical protein
MCGFTPRCWPKRSANRTFEEGEAEVSERRFEMWAGVARFEGDDMVCDWPIIDRQNCGRINGFPKREQWFCATPTSQQQSQLCDWLNAHEPTAPMVNTNDRNTCSHPSRDGQPVSNP